jgi:TolB-like protein
VYGTLCRYEQDYFADGISEELLNLLAQVPELRVLVQG